MQTDAIAFRSVSAGYRKRPVLQDVSFTVPEGEFVCLIGPNGSGKSTLLKTAAGLLRPSHGMVRVFGYDISALKPRLRASLIGVVPQKIDSPMAFTVRQIVMNGRGRARRSWGVPSQEDDDIAERVMIYTNVLELQDRLFNELSAGEQQRAALAMALAQEPRIIMLDEAISHLDINHRQEVLRILMKINREKRLTVLLVSHDLNLSSQIADRLLLMQGGTIVRQGSPDEVMQDRLLSTVYDCDLQVRKDPLTGSPVVTGMLEGSVRKQAVRSRLHVVSGGGTGIELFRRLSIEGYDVSAGVLNQLDSDADAARALGIGCVLEQPFSAIGPAAIGQAAEMVSQADGVVFSRVPFGSGNLVNLDLALEALKKGKPVWIAAGIEERDYTSGREAVSRVRLLESQGAKAWSSMHDLLPEIARKCRRMT